MEATQLIDLVKKYQENREFISNEETAKVALVIPLIKLLGYDPGIPREVRLEYAAEFVQGDGKRLPDRMDFAIFDPSGNKPLIVIETKPLGTDLKSKAQQLARYISQLPELHFGVITDGCHYLLFGDLENPNVMDPEPFFTFSLDDAKADWAKIAKFLSKFSRDAFNAETLVTDAENSRYRQAMVEKLAAALKSPAESSDFLEWITEGIYRSKRTSGVMLRLGEVAKEAIEPALLRVIGDDFLNKLKERLSSVNDVPGAAPVVEGANILKADSAKLFEPESRASEDKARAGIETTEEELQFLSVVRDVCSRSGHNAVEILSRDTANYFNVSYRRPTKWFVRFFASARRKSLATWVPVEEAKILAVGFEIEPAPSAFGTSRVFIESVAQVWALRALIVRSLEISLTAKYDLSAELPSSAPALKVI